MFRIDIGISKGRPILPNIKNHEINNLWPSAFSDPTCKLLKFAPGSLNTPFFVLDSFLCPPQKTPQSCFSSAYFWRSYIWTPESLAPPKDVRRKSIEHHLIISSSTSVSDSYDQEHDGQLLMFPNQRISRSTYFLARFVRSLNSPQAEIVRSNSLQSDLFDFKDSP